LTKYGFGDDRTLVTVGLLVNRSRGLLGSIPRAVILGARVDTAVIPRTCVD
jgi:hypothetical protein